MSREAADLLILLVVITYLGHTDSAILSRNKDLSSSSTYSDWIPERAQDGNPSRDAGGCGCCAATYPQLNPWYELDLSKHYTVNRIHVEGRDDRNGQHFQGMQIYLKSVNDGIASGEETRIIEAIYNVDYVLPVPKSTRYVLLALYNVSRVFTICELTVYGECADGDFGGYCENTCHCDGDPCNKTTGVCPSGRCLPGYQGTLCNKTCTEGTYGLGCTERCGNCSSADICNIQNGRCPGQCASGYQGETCKQECASGSYGQACINKCGHCHDGEPCNQVTGHCENGCAAGYKTDSFCETECGMGTYGLGCKDECGNCKDGHGFCAKADGVCSNGCIAGYIGDICKTECEDGIFGEKCNLNCGNCLNGAACNKKTGVCAGGCMAGYTGDLCFDECPAGVYGNGCSNECGNCETNTVCHHIHGACIGGCIAGFKTPICVEECDNGTFGSGCVGECGRCYGNKACDKETGICLGCEQGFYGYDCKLEMSSREVSDESISRVTALAISGWIFAGILVIVGILYFIRIRIRSRQKSPTVDNSLYEIPNNNRSEQEHQYECAVVNTPDPLYTNTS